MLLAGLASVHQAVVADSLDLPPRAQFVWAELLVTAIRHPSQPSLNEALAILNEVIEPLVAFEVFEGYSSIEDARADYKKASS